ncbi:helix-turn-helix domain-containing protein [Cohnella hongkongensis]|uniref:Helix-turn-helix domain-containing protein n=1 Tax=Cohnella hongkongensis TaxID=178337 RepID=A0ABV9FIA2_9BACL
MHSVIVRPEPFPLLLLSSIYRRRLRDPASVRQFRSPARMLVYVTGGAGTVWIEEKQYPVASGALYHLPPGASVEWIGRGGFTELYVLLIDARCLVKRKGVWETSVPSNEKIERLLPPGRAPAEDPESALKRFEEMHRCRRDQPRDPVKLQLLFQGLVHELAAQRPLGGESKEVDGSIGLSVDYMHSRYREKIKLETLSDISGFTPTSYSREFKKCYGLSPIDYLNRYRIEQAKQMLAERNRSIKDVSAASGFGNEFYFSRMFKRHVGISPSHYVKRTDLRIAVASTLRFQDMLDSLGASPVYSANCHKSKTMDRATHQTIVAGKIAEMRQAAPDLILCDDYHRPFLEQLKQIAPTVVISLSMDWRVNNRRIAEIIGREAEAERNFKQLERRVEEARAPLRERYGNGSVTIMRVIHKLIRIQGLSNHPINELIYRDLGLKPGFCVPSNAMNVEFSPDNYPDMDTDHLFVQTLFFYPEDETIFAGMQKSPRWQAIRAVANDCVRQTPNWVGMSWSTSGRMRIIEELLQ